MIHIAIVEDDANFRRELAVYLKQYSNEHGYDFDIREYSDGADLVEYYTGQYDILFLDIEMPGLDGMKAAEAIRAEDDLVQIVFVTNLAQRAADGYQVDARAFLIKPLRYPSLQRCLDRVLTTLEKRKDVFLTLNNTREMHRINLKTVYYIESMGHYVKVHTESGVVIAHASMKSLEQKLLGNPFFRCSSSCIVNLAKVDTVDQTELTIHGNRISVSRSRKKDLMNALNRYYTGLS